LPRPGAQGRGEVAHGANPLESSRWGPGPNEASILRKDLGGKVPGVI
jgi:hypothetical protein